MAKNESKHSIENMTLFELFQFEEVLKRRNIELTNRNALCETNGLSDEMKKKMVDDVIMNNKLLNLVKDRINSEVEEYVKENC